MFHHSNYSIIEDVIHKSVNAEQFSSEFSISQPEVNNARISNQEHNKMELERMLKFIKNPNNTYVQIMFGRETVGNKVNTSDSEDGNDEEITEAVEGQKTHSEMMKETDVDETSEEQSETCDEDSIHLGFEHNDDSLNEENGEENYSDPEIEVLDEVDAFEPFVYESLEEWDTSDSETYPAPHDTDGIDQDIHEFEENIDVQVNTDTTVEIAEECEEKTPNSQLEDDGEVENIGELLSDTEISEDHGVIYKASHEGEKIITEDSLAKDVKRCHPEIQPCVKDYSGKMFLKLSNKMYYTNNKYLTAVHRDEGIWNIKNILSNTWFFKYFQNKFMQKQSSDSREFTIHNSTVMHINVPANLENVALCEGCRRRLCRTFL